MMTVKGEAWHADRRAPRYSYYGGDPRRFYRFISVVAFAPVRPGDDLVLSSMSAAEARAHATATADALIRGDAGAGAWHVQELPTDDKILAGVACWRLHLAFREAKRRAVLSAVSSAALRGDPVELAVYEDEGEEGGYGYAIYPGGRSRFEPGGNDEDGWQEYAEYSVYPDGRVEVVGY